MSPRMAVLALLVVMAILALWFFREVLLPFALALLLAYLLTPVVNWLEQRGIGRLRLPRGVSILGIYVLILGLLVLSGYFLFPRLFVEMNRMVKTLPRVLQQLEHETVQPLEQSLNRWVAEVFPPSEAPSLASASETAQETRAGTPSDPKADVASAPWRGLVEDYTYVVKQLDGGGFEIVPHRRQPKSMALERQPFRFNWQLSGAFNQFRDGIERNFVEFALVGRNLVGTMLNSFFKLFLVLMISGFILLDPKRISRFLRSVIPAAQDTAYQDWLGALDRGLSGVVRGQVTICVVNGVLTGIGIGIMGVPFAVTLSIIAAVLSLIPIFGVLISTIPIVLMALTVSLGTALGAVLWVLIVHFIEGNFLNPKILGDSAKIHPVLIVFALLAGEHFAGVVGALLAVPIFSLIQNSFLFLKTKAESMDVAP